MTAQATTARPATAPSGPLTEAERAELEFLRAENGLLRAERAILLRIATDAAAPSR